MKKNNIKMRAISGLLVGGLLLSIGTISFADSVDNNIVSTTSQGIQRMFNKDKDFTGDRAAMREMKGEFGDRDFGAKGQKDGFAEDKLVEDGILTQEKADAIQNYTETKMEEYKAIFEEATKDMTAEEKRAYLQENRPEKTDMFAELVEEGILTQEEADAIQVNMPERDFEDREAKGQKGEFGENKLVEEGILTQEKVDALKEYKESNREEHQAIFEAAKDMTAEEREAYIEANRSEKTDMFAELVEEGILTQEDVDAIQANMPERELGDRDSMMQGQRGGMMKGGRR